MQSLNCCEKKNMYLQVVTSCEKKKKKIKKKLNSGNTVICQS